MVETTSDPSKKIKWYFRINRDGLKTFLVFDNTGAAKVLTGYVPVINFKRREGEANFLQLAIGSGITSVAGGWAVALTKVQAATFREMTYFVELVITQGGLERNWISGDAVFHNGRFDGVTTDSSSLTVYDDGGTVSISLTESSAGGSGDVVGPASATSGNLAVFSGTTGKLIADGGAVPSLTNISRGVPFLVSPSAANAITNQPLAETYYISSNRHVMKFDGTKYTAARLVANITTGSASGSSPRLYAKWKTTFDPSTALVGDFTTLGSGTGSETVSLTSIALVASDWITLPAGAKADVFWCIAGAGGDGAADPALGMLTLQFRI